MGKILSKLVTSRMAKGTMGGLKQADKVSILVRLLRAIYIVDGTAITVLWYTGWRNERVQEGDKTNLPIPGLSKLKGSGWQGAARQDAPPPSTGASGTNAAPSAGAPVGSGGGEKGHAPLIRINMAGALLAWSAPDKDKKLGNYNVQDYHKRMNSAVSIAAQYHLHITSGYRPGTGSLHNTGLAFDMVGSLSDMRKAAEWASTRNDLFQEVFLHDAGSGLHVHLGFYPDSGVINTVRNIGTPGHITRQLPVIPSGRSQPLA